MLHTIHGTDSYRIQEAIPAGIRIDCAEASAPDDLARRLKYPSFFGETRCVVVTNAAHDAMGAILDTYDLTTLTDVNLIAVQDTSIKGYNKKVLAKLIKASDTTLLKDPLAGPALIEWMTTYCTLRGASLSKNIAEHLVRTVGQDTRTIANELEKLIAYAQGTPIDTAMIALLSIGRVERDEWELSNAVASHNKRSVIATLWKKLHEGSAEQLIAGSIAAGFRNLLMVQDLLNRTQPPAAIAKTTGLHPFVISKTLAGARIADQKRLTQAHLALARLDRDAKDGHADMVDSLFAVLLAL